MKTPTWPASAACCLALAATFAAVVGAGEPLALLPENPHYFVFQGRPTALVTSGEHYGAVLNRDFDYTKYLDELAACELNLTRTFTGAYVEPLGAFNIARNTLAPLEGKLIAPWPRSDQPGYAGGGNKFDLSKWDDAYFARLHDFVAQAEKRGVVVEMSVFCPMYEDKQWVLSPMNAANNVNALGKVARDHVYTLDKHGGLLDVQEKLTKKIVEELCKYDNVYYEVCNEPYFGGVTMEWQHYIADLIVATEKKLGRTHLIAMNIANGSQKIEKPHPAVSIFNFHYASPPTAVTGNYALEKVIGLNETGFKGTAPDYYRKEAWQFVLAGGGLYNNLDYSFVAGHEDGTFEYPASQPGTGSRAFRQQMQTLKRLLQSLDLKQTRPTSDLLAEALPDGQSFSALGQGKEQFLAYLHGGNQTDLKLKLPPGEYVATWINLQDGSEMGVETLQGGDKSAVIKSPRYEVDIALKLARERTTNE